MNREFKKELVKLLVEFDESVDDWIHPQRQLVIQMNAKKMFDEGLLETDYNKKCRMRVVLQSNTDSERDDIMRFREPFKKAYSGYLGYSSDNQNVKRLLDEYLAVHTNHTLQQCVDASKHYVDFCIQTGEYMMKCENFILNKLASVIEDMESSEPTSQNSMSDLI